MKIVFQHDHPLPVKKYGGIERMLFWLMKELAHLGHEVVLIGHPKSDLSKFNISLIPMEGKDWHHLVPKDADIIHLSYNHIVPCEVPTIVTLHGNGQPGEVFPANTVFLSEKHAQNHGGNYFIYNALDLEEYPFQERKKEWNQFLFLAKASWKVKNLKDCLRGVKASGKHLNVIGGTSILPKKNTTFHGYLDGTEKLNIINSSDALLYPIRWQEPFGLAVIEAMSQGLPAITSPFGSMKELINEDNGVVVQNFSELVETMSISKKDYSSLTIRKYVEDNFHISIYAKKYLEVY